MTDIHGRRALITGAAGGIGSGLASELARRGARLVLWDVDADGLQRLRAELERDGHAVDSYVCDLTDRQQIADTAAQTLADGGPIDILVNNAGIVSGNHLLDI